MVEAVTAAHLRVGTNHEPVWPHRNLGAKSSVAGGLNTKGTGRGFRVKEIPQGSALNQGETSGWCSLSIEGCRTDVSGVEAVIVEVEEGNRHIGSNRIPLAQAHPIEHRTRIEHAAEGTKQ